jgi:hypothetical protein
MSLLNVVNAVRDDFVKSNCPARVLFGKQWSAENDAPNRVVFFPSEDTYQPDIFSGANPRPIYTRNVGGEAHLWAAAPPQADANQQPDKDQDVLDALVNQTALSLYNVSKGPGVTIVSGSQVQGVLLVRLGLAYVLRFTVQIPVLDIQFPKLGITSDVRTWAEINGATAVTTVELIDSPDEGESD